MSDGFVTNRNKMDKCQAERIRFYMVVGFLVSSSISKSIIFKIVIGYLGSLIFKADILYEAYYKTAMKHSECYIEM